MILLNHRDHPLELCLVEIHPVILFIHADIRQLLELQTKRNPSNRDINMNEIIRNHEQCQSVIKPWLAQSSLVSSDVALQIVEMSQGWELGQLGPEQMVGWFPDPQLSWFNFLALLLLKYHLNPQKTPSLFNFYPKLPPGKRTWLPVRENSMFNS